MEAIAIETWPIGMWNDSMESFMSANANFRVFSASLSRLAWKSVPLLPASPTALPWV
jgi:hypothetical protein